VSGTVRKEAKSCVPRREEAKALRQKGPEWRPLSGVNWKRRRVAGATASWELHYLELLQTIREELHKRFKYEGTH
jgi:hypothetical protein